MTGNNIGDMGAALLSEGLKENSALLRLTLGGE